MLAFLAAVPRADLGALTQAWGPGVCCSARLTYFLKISEFESDVLKLKIVETLKLEDFAAVTDDPAATFYFVIAEKLHFQLGLAKAIGASFFL